MINSEAIIFFFLSFSFRFVLFCVPSTIEHHTIAYIVELVNLDKIDIIVFK